MLDLIMRADAKGRKGGGGEWSNDYGVRDLGDQRRLLKRQRGTKIARSMVYIWRDVPKRLDKRDRGDCDGTGGAGAGGAAEAHRQEARSNKEKKAKPMGFFFSVSLLFKRVAQSVGRKSRTSQRARI